MRSALVYACAAGLLVTAFQNCGGIKFNSSGAGATTERSTAGEPTRPPNADEPVTAPVADCETLAAPRETTADDRVYMGSAHVPFIADAGQVTVMGITAGDVVVGNANRLNAMNLKGSLIGAAIKGQALDVAGAVCLTSADVTVLQNIKGRVRLRAMGSAPAKFGSILDVRDLEIENFEGRIIQNVRGRLTLRRTKVHTIQGLVGQLELLDGSEVVNLLDSQGAPIPR